MPTQYQRIFDYFLRRKFLKVSPQECVHYCGFIYNSGKYNPYRNYIEGLNKGIAQKILRNEFEEFFRFYRPEDLGSALGIILSQKYQLWYYPWTRKLPSMLELKNGWHSEPNQVSDIMTQFCSKGIPKSLLYKEYTWLESAYENIRTNGYLPEKYGYPIGYALYDLNGEKRFILKDGNHRVSALSVLGYDEFEITVNFKDQAKLSEIKKWNGIQKGNFTRSDAKKIFKAYFNGNESYRTTSLGAIFVD
jgi:hypothetical protein